MTQHNWNWWFILTILCFVVLCDLAMINHPFLKTVYSDIITGVWVVNTIGCLYVGTKSEQVETNF